MARRYTNGSIGFVEVSSGCQGTSRLGKDLKPQRSQRKIRKGREHDQLDGLVIYELILKVALKAFTTKGTKLHARWSKTNVPEGACKTDVCKG